MNIGYACLTIGVAGAMHKTCTVKNATPDVLSNLMHLNLQALNNIIDYNIKNDIKIFRISSDIIPFGSHPVNTLKWWEILRPQLKEIGYKASQNGMRLSMHPGQYTVLNSPDEGVVERAIKDLRYHTRFLDALDIGMEHKIILHVGGTYGNKTAAMTRFIQQYRSLDENIRKRLVIENDDRHYTVSDVISIGNSERIPVVFDNLHHQVNPDNARSEIEWIDACINTWHLDDGCPELHYSQQNVGKRPGSHSDTLDMHKFLEFYSRLGNRNVNIVVEVKDKNLSAIKCINTVSSPEIRRLEKEWERYKYLVLERYPKKYQEIRQLLKDKKSYPVLEFYGLIDEAMKSSVKKGNAINAALHIWGYFKKTADESERQRFEQTIQKVFLGGSTLYIKRLLLRLAEEQKQKYLLNSLYFMELL